MKKLFVIQVAKGVDTEIFGQDELPKEVEHIVGDTGFELVRAIPDVLSNALVDKPYLQAIPAPDGRYVDAGGYEVAVVNGECFETDSLPPEMLVHLPTY